MLNHLHIPFLHMPSQKGVLGSVVVAGEKLLQGLLWAKLDSVTKYHDEEKDVVTMNMSVPSFPSVDGRTSSL